MSSLHEQQGDYAAESEAPVQFSLAFDTIAGGVWELDNEANTHEIILVHGFAVPGNTEPHEDCRERTSQGGHSLHDGSEYTRARHILEEWICDSAEVLQERVVVRRMAFNTAEVLGYGKKALCSAAHFLCNSLLSLTLDSGSPLFHGAQRTIGDLEEDCFYSHSAGGLLPVFQSRKVTFIAHGLGIWVVKQALLWLHYHGTPLHPAAMFFFDIAWISTPDVIFGYLQDTASIFALPWPSTLQGLLLEDVERHLFRIEQDFGTLIAGIYGECSEIIHGDEEKFEYHLIQYNHQLWHNPSLLQSHNADSMAASTSSLTDFVAGQIRRLTSLKLEKHLEEAVSLRLVTSSPDRLESRGDWLVGGTAFAALNDAPPTADAAEYDDVSVASSQSQYSSKEVDYSRPPDGPKQGNLYPEEWGVDS
ncbi:uncharacterized protein B0I36DRAFT_356861 [Microdochium trichocladiopsis]|uniref:Uncharacterized protein n=1 Tax=Microdochium trichocladiopsis TaxID=1682393 RepID=A0A9P9BH17_9PEZI|nr:uncharacterized protein B0I36DRAFT_356861 [Microdochium trichocladiopsis]KAH7009139.1 hypothetical protein B0I36DRAFT_356861 [Microdochium trichocladiopsis]